MKLKFGIKTALVALVVQLSCLTASAQEVEFNDVSYDVDGRYLEITFTAEITDAKDKSITLEVTFYDNSKRPIRSLSKEYANDDNILAVATKVRPKSRKERFNNVKVRIPIDEFKEINFTSETRLYFSPKAIKGKNTLRGSDELYVFRIDKSKYYDNGGSSTTIGVVDNTASDVDKLINGNNPSYNDYKDNKPNESSFDKLKREAQNGNKNSQYELGNCYYNGKRVTRNYTSAAAWYQKAATQGHTDAQYLIGKMYYEGKGVSKSTAKAKQWLEKASRSGNKEAEKLLRKIR